MLDEWGTLPSLEDPESPGFGEELHFQKLKSSNCADQL
jgi:hypothetical protein